MDVNDIKLIKELYDKYNKSVRINSKVLTDLFNKVFNKKEKAVNCSTCLRHRLFELVELLPTEEDIKFINWASHLEEGHYPSFEKVVDIYNRVFKKNEEYTNCLPCIKQMLSQLQSIL